jgi:environmental stress-induced protein Ves
MEDRGMAFVMYRNADYQRMRWKNGLGETAQIAISPDGATLDGFDWRISMARVEADGPFSPFAGIDRTLSILEGDGLHLSPAGREAVVLGPASAPCGFAGDLPCRATLVGGAVTDLNVMTRRHQYWHRVRRLATGPTVAAADLAAAFLIASAFGPVTVLIDGATLRLAAFDSVSLGPGPWSVVVPEVVPEALLLVEIGVAAP